MVSSGVRERERSSSIWSRRREIGGRPEGTFFSFCFFVLFFVIVTGKAFECSPLAVSWSTPRGSPREVRWVLARWGRDWTSNAIEPSSEFLAGGTKDPRTVGTVRQCATRVCSKGGAYSWLVSVRMQMSWSGRTDGA